MRRPGSLRDPPSDIQGHHPASLSLQCAFAAVSAEIFPAPHPGVAGFSRFGALSVTQEIGELLRRHFYQPKSRSE
jgi:hypothetical protein